MTRRLVAALAVVVAVWSLAPSVASAHPLGTTLVVITATDDGVDLDVTIPFDQLARADSGLGDSATTAVADHAGELRRSLLDGIDVGDGTTTWTLAVSTIEATTLDGAAQVHAVLHATSPTTPVPEVITLGYRVVVDAVATHQVYVAAGTDAALVGTIDQGHTSIVVSVDHPTPVSFTTMVHAGIDHFRTGTDHLLFLTLVAAGSVLVRQSVRRRLGDLVVRTAAFTVGHSASLALAAAGLVTLPSRLVETAIAVTIVVAAIDLWHPFVARRWEPVITLAFGFVHGFGFASALRDLGLRGAHLVLPTFGFNVGLELAQLGAAVAVVPSLWYLARSSATRRGIALVSGVLAGAWAIERAFGVGNPTTAVGDLLLATPERLAIVLAAVALSVAVATRGRDGDTGDTGDAGGAVSAPSAAARRTERPASAGAARP